MKANYLKTRWLENQSSRLFRKKIIQIFEDEGILEQEHTPFGVTSNNLSDFRGLDLSNLKIKKFKVENSDFSNSNFKNSQIENSVFNNIFFENVDLENILDKKNLFYKTTFINCRLNRAGIGYDGTNYSDCIFKKTNFVKSVFTRGEFANCKFIDCNFKAVDFNASSFDGCSFNGKLLDVWFRGGYALASEVKEFGKNKKNKMVNVSFEEAVIEGVNFSNDCDLSTIIPPRSGNYKLYDNWLCRLEHLKTIITDWDTDLKREGEIFVNSYLGHAKSQDWFLINIEELQKEFGNEVTNNIINTLNATTQMKTPSPLSR